MTHRSKKYSLGLAWTEWLGIQKWYTAPASKLSLSQVTTGQGWFRTSFVLAATKPCNPMHPLLSSFMSLTKTSHLILYYWTTPSNPLSSNYYTYFKSELSTCNLVKKLSIFSPFSLLIHWNVFATKCVTLLGLNNFNFLPLDLSLKTRKSSSQVSQMFRSYQLKIIRSTVNARVGLL